VVEASISGGKKRETPPTSPKDSLGLVVGSFAEERGVDVAGVEGGGEEGKTPTSHRDSLGVVVGGVEVGERKKPPQRVSRRRWGSMWPGWAWGKEKTAQRVSLTRWGS